MSEQVTNTLSIYRKNGKEIKEVESFINNNFVNEFGNLDFNKVYTPEERLKDYNNLSNDEKIKLLSIEEPWVTVKLKNDKFYPGMDEGDIKKGFIEGRIQLSKHGINISTPETQGIGATYDTKNKKETLEEFEKNFEITDISLDHLYGGLDLFTYHLIDHDNVKDLSDRPYEITFEDFHSTFSMLLFKRDENGDITSNPIDSYSVIEPKKGSVIEGLLKEAKNMLEKNNISSSDIHIDTLNFNEVRKNFELQGIRINHDLINADLDKQEKISTLVLNFNTNYEQPKHLIEKMSKKIGNHLISITGDKEERIIVEGEYSADLNGDYLIESGTTINHTILSKDIGSYYGKDYLIKNTRNNGRGTEIKKDNETWEEINTRQMYFNGELFEKEIYALRVKDSDEAFLTKDIKNIDSIIKGDNSGFSSFDATREDFEVNNISKITQLYDLEGNLVVPEFKKEDITEEVLVLSKLDIEEKVKITIKGGEDKYFNNIEGCVREINNGNIKLDYIQNISKYKEYVNLDDNPIVENSLIAEDVENEFSSINVEVCTKLNKEIKNNFYEKTKKTIEETLLIKEITEARNNYQDFFNKVSILNNIPKLYKEEAEKLHKNLICKIEEKTQFKYQARLKKSMGGDINNNFGI